MQSQKQPPRRSLFIRTQKSYVAFSIDAQFTYLRHAILKRSYTSKICVLFKKMFYNLLHAVPDIHKK